MTTPRGRDKRECSVYETVARAAVAAPTVAREMSEYLEATVANRQ